MPKLISNSELFQQLITKASECRVVRSEKDVKLKLRTPTFLYTYITNPDEAQDLIKTMKNIEVIEFGVSKKVDKESSKNKEKPEEPT